jgi:hypothetical protein
LGVVDPQYIYPALLREVKAFIETGKSPVDPDQSVQVVAFMEAANESMAQGGKPVALKG